LLGGRREGSVSQRGSARLICPSQTRACDISFRRVLGEGPIPLVRGQGTLLKMTAAYPALGTPRQISPPNGSKRISLYLDMSVKESFPSKHKI
jgi:hypothetical protein